MNIFYLHEDPKISAAMHVDSHASKMIIEYAQLMSTAHRVLDGKEYYGLTKNSRKIKRWKLNSKLEHILYKASHVNHPSGIWVRQSRGNYFWLYELWKELNKEFMYRYDHDKSHESFRKLEDALYMPPMNIPDGTWTEPTPAMPDDVKDKCSLTAYRNYYIEYKQHLAKWGKREEPHWYVRAA